jgi:predicted nucleic acid-binding Zn ribbon protein
MIEAHKHCAYCGINIPPKEVFCSAICQETLAGHRQRAVRAQRMVAALFLVLALAILLGLR